MDHRIYTRRLFSQGLVFCRPGAHLANINIPGWMMNSTFENFRAELFSRSAIISLIHNGRGVFGSDFGSCAFCITNVPVKEFRGKYKRLFRDQANVASNEQLSERFQTAQEFEASPAEFEYIKAEPISYHVSSVVRKAYRNMRPISQVANACQGLSTSDDGRFVRYWHEVSSDETAKFGESVKCDSSFRWFPYNKGGVFRKWYGNIEHVIDWANSGAAIKAEEA